MTVETLTIRTDDGWSLTFSKRDGSVTILATRGFISLERTLERREVAQLRAWLDG